MMDGSMNAAELAAEQLRADALRQVNEAEAMVTEGQRLIAEGESRIEAGQAAAAEARMRLSLAEDFIANLRQRMAQRDGNGATSVAATAESNSTSSESNVESRSMAPLLDELLSDGAWHTIDGLVAAMQRRGYEWSRGSVMNRCSDRAKRGVYARLVRNGRSFYRLAAASGDRLPPGLPDPGGERETEPEGGSQHGAGQAAALSGFEGSS
jgi:hypothetical protein